MACINMVILLGNVGRDPEIRRTDSGASIANFSVALSEKWKDKQTGEAKEKTEWAKVVVFGDSLVSVVERFVQKGSQIHVIGKMQTRKWTDNAGAEKYTTEVVVSGFDGKITLLGSPGGRGGSDRNDSSAGGGYQQPVPQQPRAQKPVDLDDDIPF